MLAWLNGCILDRHSCRSQPRLRVLRRGEKKKGNGKLDFFPNLKKDLSRFYSILKFAAAVVENSSFGFFFAFLEIEGFSALSDSHRAAIAPRIRAEGGC